MIWLAFTQRHAESAGGHRHRHRIVKPRLQTVPGVADVQINGDRKYSMRIWLDPDQLAAYRLTVQDVEDALRRQNLEVPAGRIESQQREFNVTARTDLNTVTAVQRGGAQVVQRLHRAAEATWRASSRRR